MKIEPKTNMKGWDLFQDFKVELDVKTVLEECAAAIDEKIKIKIAEYEHSAPIESVKTYFEAGDFFIDLSMRCPEKGKLNLSFKDGSDRLFSVDLEDLFIEEIEWCGYENITAMILQLEKILDLAKKHQLQEAKYESKNIKEGI